MKAFVDANVIIAVLNKEYPAFTHAARVLSLSDNRKYQLYTSPVCFAIAFYFSSKKSGAEVAKKKMAILAEKLKIAEVKQQHVLNAAVNKKVLDFEDGMQYYAAFDAGCSCIITEDVDDYYFSELEVLSAENFLRQHVIKQ
jgi:predicted nucleic acid-binding protein